jgi:hypothetical protein
MTEIEAAFQALPARLTQGCTLHKSRLSTRTQRPEGLQICISLTRQIEKPTSYECSAVDRASLIYLPVARLYLAVRFFNFAPKVLNFRLTGHVRRLLISGTPRTKNAGAAASEVTPDTEEACYSSIHDTTKRARD